MLQEEMNSRPNYNQTGMDSPPIQKEWSTPSNLSQDSSIDEFKPMNQLGFSLDEPCLNSVTSSGNCTPACQGIPTSFSTSSASYDHSSKLLQTLFGIDPQSQNSVSDTPSMINPSKPNYQTKLNAFSPSLPQFSPFLPKREKPNCLNVTAKSCNEDVQYTSSVVNKPLKRLQIETPSPLPTFKVRKQKLGDRITALQQLVSPFGKTDTVSVLHEAIEYIKFLHEQVGVLSTPYMRSVAPIQHQQVDLEGPKQDLRSRGLCLVPISSTFPLVNETTADFWTPTFGGTFRMQMGSSSTNVAMLENLRCGLKTESDDDDNNKGKLHYGCPNQMCKFIPLNGIASKSSITQQTVNQKVGKGQLLELDMLSKLRSQNAYFSRRLQAFGAAHRLMKMVLFATMMLYILAIIIGVTSLIGK